MKPILFFFLAIFLATMVVVFLIGDTVVSYTTDADYFDFEITDEYVRFNYEWHETVTATVPETPCSVCTRDNDPDTVCANVCY